jgi:hypothetical protein
VDAYERAKYQSAWGMATSPFRVIRPERLKAGFAPR